MLVVRTDIEEILQSKYDANPVSPPLVWTGLEILHRQPLKK
jgi:hypothetical protein